MSLIDLSNMPSTNPASQMLLLSLFLVVTLIQLYFWGYVFGKLARYESPVAKATSEEETCPPVSIIICAHNEAENLHKYLPLFLRQDYPQFEVLLINDHSTDKTLEVALDIQNKYPLLCVLSVPKKKSRGKKAALSYGIRQASFETLLLSDADCQPASRQWLANMQRSFSDNKSIVLGYGPYHKRRGWLNRFIRFEAFYTAIQYFSFALMGLPYMGVGRNLAYHRKIFQQADGFSGHAHLLSGDDDLLVNQMATADDTAINLFSEAWVYSDPKTSWRSYYIQKRRHLSVGRHYRWQHQLALGILAASHAAFYGLMVLLLLMYPAWWPILTLIYLVRMAMILQVSTKISKHLGERDLLPFLPLLDLAFLAYYFLFVPTLITGSRIQQWK